MTKRLCGIPSGTLGPCDLEYGHDGFLHGSCGDGFHARAYDEDHHKAQQERAASTPPDRIAKLRTQALARIEQCRKDENKFLNSVAALLKSKGPRASTHNMPQAAIEAWVERRAWQEVLRILDGED